MDIEQDYKITGAVEELAIVRKTIVETLNIIRDTNQCVIDKINRVKNEINDCDDIKCIDYATQLDDINENMIITNKLIDGLLN